MVSIMDLDSYSSEMTPLPIPEAIAQFDTFSDHSLPFSYRSIDTEIHFLYGLDCRENHPSPFSLPEIVPDDNELLSEHTIIKNDTTSPSIEIDLKRYEQSCGDTGPLVGCSNILSSTMGRASTVHMEMVHSFQNAIKNLGTEEDKATMSRLMRHALSVRGVRMLNIRCKLHQWYRDWVNSHGAVPDEIQKDFAFELIQSEWYEDKLAAVLFLQEVLIARKKLSFADFSRFEDAFRGGHIKTYRVCDHFASKILCHILEQSNQKLDERARMQNRLFQWTLAEDLWQARAAMIVLASQTKSEAGHKELINSVQHMLDRPEEEAKSVAGAALRSISDLHPETVVEFLNRVESIAKISTAGLDKATSRLTKRQREYFKKLRTSVREAGLYSF